MPEKKPKCITHNYQWESGKNGIIIHKCKNCREKVAIVKIADYMKFDAKRTLKEEYQDELDKQKPDNQKAGLD